MCAKKCYWKMYKKYASRQSLILCVPKAKKSMFSFQKFYTSNKQECIFLILNAAMLNGFSIKNSLLGNWNELIEVEYPLVINKCI